MIVVFLVTVLWSIGDPVPIISVQADINGKPLTFTQCTKLAASFDKAAAYDNEVNMPAFQQGYRAACFQLPPEDGPDVRGPI